MIGRIDESLRALVDINVGANADYVCRKVTTWNDSGFNGHLVLSRILSDELELVQDAATEAILADGSIVILELFLCYVDWCGTVMPAQVIANDGRYPLLGTEFLRNGVVVLDYKTMTISVTQ